MKEITNTKLGFGLVPSKPDDRHFKFGALFKLPELKDIPDTFMISDKVFLKQQKETDYCTGEAGTAVSEDQEEVELDPLFQFFKAKTIEGKMDSWGCDLVSMAKSMVQYGSIEQSISPFTIDSPREEILDKNNWPESFDKKAAVHKKESFMLVTGPYDTFDNIRATMWKSKLDGKKQSVVTGVYWCPEWSNSKDGVIDFEGTPSFGHAIKLCGSVIRNGQVMIVAQLSNGIEFGDQGFFYFSRMIVDKCFTFEAIVFTDVPRYSVDFHIVNNVKIDDNWIIKILKFFINLFQYK